MLRSVGAVVAGFLFIFVASMTAGAVVQALVPGAVAADGSITSVPVLLASQVCVAVAAIAGCYLTARLAGRRPMEHALVLGGLGLAFNILGTFMQWGLIPTWYLVLSLVLVMPYAWLGGRLRERQLEGAHVH